MTTFTPPIKAPAARAHPGFTLAEVMVSASLATLVLAGVMSAFLFIGRTSFSAGSYSEMEAETRRALDRFANDVRMATGIRWNSAQSITLILPTATNATTQVTYAYDPLSVGATARTFYRVPGDASALPRQPLVRGVAPDFSFQRYKLEQSGVTSNIAANDLETKLIQVDLQPTRAGVTAGVTTQRTISARYLLRNKRVSQ